MTKMPYHFVPVKADLTIRNKPVDHLRIDRSRKSGEMLMSLRTLTPTICGHYQFKFSDLPQNVQNELNDPKIGTFVANKHILEPLVLPTTENPSRGRVAIPGTSLKGMIRQAVSSLLSSPMERVQEKKFSFRPNLSPQNTDQIIPAIITDINQDGMVTVGWGRMNDFIFCKKECRDVFARESLSTRITGKTINGVAINRAAHCNKLGVANGGAAEFRSALIGKYHYGIDGSGYFAGAFRNSPPNAVYKWGIIDNFNERNTLVLPTNLLKQFVRTMEYFYDRKEGHLVNHPKSPEGDDFVEAMKKLRNQGIRKGVVVFLELPAGQSEPNRNGSNILSMGFHFRYRWLYRDSILRKQGKLRAEIFDSEKEELNDSGLTVETNATRTFFGFTDEKKKKSLAGRISVNMALEQNFLRPDDQRFVIKNNKTFLVLRPLGSPKPSAVETYLTQENIEKREDCGNLCTYGEFIEDKAAGDLNGRKGYLHQPTANANIDQFLLPPSDENYLSEQSTIANLVSRANTEFRFKLRFANLEDWEIGILLFATSPEAKDVTAIFEGMNLGKGVTLPSELKKLIAREESGDKNLPLFAQKIGHGRPLGLGSIKIDIDAINTWDFSKNSPELVKDRGSREQYLKALGSFVSETLKERARDWLKLIVLQWLKIRRFRDRVSYTYPTLTGKDGKETIFNFHSDIRKNHSQMRKKKGKPSKSGKTLSDLD